MVIAVQNALEEVFGAHVAEEQNRRRSFSSGCHFWLVSPFQWQFVLQCFIDCFYLVIFGSKSGVLILLTAM